MLKRIMKMAVVLIGTTMMMTSCYSTTSIVGSGAQGNSKVTQWNHYLIGGLAPVSVSNSKEMAGDAENYTIETQQSFVNGLIKGLTFGLYTPTTTTVTR